MKPSAVLGAVLIVLGLLALAYQGITYTSRETVIDIGPVHATADRQKTLPLPPVLGIVAVVGGVVLLAGVHDQAAADRAGNSLAEFETGQPARDHFLDQRSERNPGSGANLQFVDPDKVEAFAEPHDQAPDAQIADQQIGPCAEAEGGNVVAIGQRHRGHIGS